MRGGNRRFSRGIVNHLYQIARKGEVIFYSISDHLVYFTIFCTYAKKHDIRVIKLCQMPDHIHGSVTVERKAQLSAFERDVTSIFAREHNQVCHRKGPFFKTPFGSVPKYGDKKARSNFIYVDNNPVERRICGKAEQYRWNYLAYALSDHPFSEPFRAREASNAMLRAVRIVKDRQAHGLHLPYATLKWMFRPLNEKERKQLVDIIVTTYSVIDYEASIRFFDSLDDMFTAIHSTTGSEYDLNEVFVGKDDSWYRRMADIVMRHCHLTDIHDMLAYPPDRKYELFQLLRRETQATAEQIAKFLRIPLGRPSRTSASKSVDNEKDPGANVPGNIE